MGIPIPPEPPPFGENVPECWAADITPSVLYATFTGIEKGALWVPGLPEPPNRTYTLQQTMIPYPQWIEETDEWICAYTPVYIFIPQTLVVLRYMIPPLPVKQAFLFNIQKTCVFYMENSYSEPPPRIYKNGFCQINS